MNGIGKQKIKYKDPNSVKFDTLDHYLVLAKKAISKFANNTFNGLSSKMIKDEDAISFIANSIMMADWRWDENYVNATGTKKSRYSYRNQCAIWAIQTYAKQFYSKKQKILSQHLSLDHTTDDSSLIHTYIADKNSKNPLDLLIEKETTEDLKDIIKNLLTTSNLSEKQKEYIKLYYFDGLTLDKIGKQFNITREAVRQNLSKALNSIREYL